MRSSKLTEVFTIRLPRDLVSRVCEMAAAEYERPTVIIRRLIRRGFEMENVSEQRKVR